METVQQNGRFTLFSSKFPSNIYSLSLSKSFKEKGLKRTVLNLVFRHFQIEDKNEIKLK